MGASTWVFDRGGGGLDEDHGARARCPASSPSRTAAGRCSSTLSTYCAWTSIAVPKNESCGQLRARRAVIGVVVDVARDRGLGEQAARELGRHLRLGQVRDPQQRHVVQVGHRRQRMALDVVDDGVPADVEIRRRRGLDRRDREGGRRRVVVLVAEHDVPARIARLARAAATDRQRERREDRRQDVTLSHDTEVYVRVRRCPLRVFRRGRISDGRPTASRSDGPVSSLLSRGRALRAPCGRRQAPPPCVRWPAMGDSSADWEAKLRETEELFRTTVENMPVNLVVCDRDGRLLYLNPQLAAMVSAMCGRTPEEIIGLRGARGLAAADLDPAARAHRTRRRHRRAPDLRARRRSPRRTADGPPVGGGPAAPAPTARSAGSSP